MGPTHQRRGWRYDLRYSSPCSMTYYEALHLNLRVSCLSDSRVPSWRYVLMGKVQLSPIFLTCPTIFIMKVGRLNYSMMMPQERSGKGVYANLLSVSARWFSSREIWMIWKKLQRLNYGLHFVMILLHVLPLRLVGVLYFVDHYHIVGVNGNSFGFELEGKLDSDDYCLVFCLIIANMKSKP